MGDDGRIGNRCLDKLEPFKVKLVDDVTAIKDALLMNLVELDNGTYRAVIVVGGEIEVFLGTLPRDEISRVARDHEEFDRGEVYVNRVDENAFVGVGQDGSRIA